MLTCQQYSELASASVDGELDQAEAAQLSDHIALCKQCKQELLDLAALRSSVVQAAAAARAPQTLHRSISDMLSANTRQAADRPRARFQWRGFTFAPAMVAAALVFFFLARPAELPLDDLQKNAFQLTGSTSFSTPDAALKHLSAEMDMDLRGVKVGKGLKFVSAGPAPLPGCRGGYVAFDDKSGRRLSILQIGSSYLKCPKGTQYVGLGCEAQQVKSCDGSRVIYWKCQDRVVAVCTDLPEDQAKAVSRSVAEQLRTD